MGKTVTDTHDASEPIVKYYPDSQSLTIETGRPQVDGETIADGVVVFYDAEDSNSVSGIYIYGAEALLKPIIDVVLSREQDVSARVQVHADE